MKNCPHCGELLGKKLRPTFGPTHRRVLEFCSTPKTQSEIADHFRWSKSTASYYTKTLVYFKKMDAQGRLPARFVSVSQP
jgi:hypothetical protein